MAFTVTIQDIQPVDNSGQGVQFLVSVLFSDSATGFTTNKTYNFPVNTSQTAAVAQITADGNVYKSGLASVSTLKQKIGSVIII